MARQRKWLKRAKKQDSKRRFRAAGHDDDGLISASDANEGGTLEDLRQPGLEIHISQPGGSLRVNPREIRTRWAQPEADLKAQIDTATAELRKALDLLPCLQALSTLVIATSMHDPENYREAESRYSPLHAEYAAWHYLSATPTPSFDDAVLDSGSMQRAFDLLDEVVDALRNYYTIRSMVAEYGEQNPREAVMVKARSWHLFVRSPSHEHHNRAQLEALFDPFDAEISTVLGFGVRDAIKAEAVLSTLFSKRINAHRKLMGETIREWQALLDADPTGLAPETVELLERFREADDPKMAARSMAMLWAQSTWHHQFLVTANELASEAQLSISVAEALLDHFSSRFGQARRPDNWPSLEETLERAPFLDLGDGRYWCGLVTKLPWAIAPAMEAALVRTTHWERYQHLHRSRWLEDRAVALIAGNDPRVGRWTRLKYGTDDELDGLVFCGGIAILIETKAGRMTLAARRGAPSGLQSDLKDLLASPQDQVNRAAKYLVANERAVFQTADGPVVVRRDDIKRIVHVIVTLDSLTAFVSQPTTLAIAGIFDEMSLPWCVDINDLQVCTEILGSPARLVHYIDRRMKASRRGVEAPEELDYLGHYLARQLYFDELSRETFQVILTSHTEALDDYYRFEGGIRKTPAPKPRHSIHPEMERFIDELEAAAPANYAEAVFWLLELSMDAQGRLADGIRTRRQRAQKLDFSAMRQFVGPRLMVYAALRQPGFRPLEPYLLASKYAARATFALGIGETVKGQDRFRVEVAYARWSKDAEMERAAGKLLGSLRSRPMSS